MRQVDEALVPGVRVDRRHHAVADAELLVQDHRDRREAVRRARRVRDQGVHVRVVRLGEVDAEDDGHVRVLARCGDDHLARAGLQVAPGVRAGTEAAGRLQHDVRAEVGPGQLGRVALGEDGDPAPRDDEVAFVHLDAAGEAVVDAVVTEQRRERLGVGEIVDRDPVDVVSTLVRGAEGRPTDAAEAVDRNLRAHRPTSSRVGSRSQCSSRAAQSASTCSWMRATRAWFSGRSRCAKRCCSLSQSSTGAIFFGVWVSR